MALTNYFDIPVKIILNGNHHQTVLVPISTIRKKPSLNPPEITIQLMSRVKLRFPDDSVELKILHPKRLNFNTYKIAVERFKSEIIS